MHSKKLVNIPHTIPIASQIIIYTTVLIGLLLNFGLWARSLNQRMIIWRAFFWAGGLLIVCLVPVPEFRTDSDSRFCAINVAVLVLLILYSQNLESNLQHKLGLLTLTTLWQARNSVFWFEHHITAGWWIWDTVFHLVLALFVGIGTHFFKD